MSIYDQIGGRDAVSAAVDILDSKLMQDDKLNHWFANTDLSKLARHQKAFIAVALGGPNEYTGQSMEHAHAGMGITHEAFDAVAGHLHATLAELGVPGETIDAIMEKVGSLRSSIVESSEVAALA